MCSLICRCVVNLVSFHSIAPNHNLYRDCISMLEKFPSYDMLEPQQLDL